MEKDFSQRGWMNWEAREREEKNIWIKSCKEAQREKPKSTLYQKVWLKMRKLMMVSDPDLESQGRRKSGKKIPGRNAASCGKNTGASVGIGKESVQ